MKAIIEIKKGESPYKIMRSSWLKDENGPVLFKLLSKMRKDDKIEATYVVERRRGIKTVLGRTIVEEERFMDAANAFRSMIWQRFPNVDLEIEDCEPIDQSSPKSTSQYQAVKNTKLNFLLLKIKECLFK